MMDFIRENFAAINDVQKGSTSSMISAIAIRIVSGEMNEEFNVFLTDLQASELVSQAQVNSWQSSVDAIFAWQDRFVEDIGIVLEEILSVA